MPPSFIMYMDADKRGALRLSLILRLDWKLDSAVLSSPASQGNFCFTPSERKISSTINPILSPET